MNSLVPLPSVIETPSLLLISLSTDFLRLVIAGDRPGAEAELGFKINEAWWQESALMKLRLSQLERDATLEPWLLRAMVRRSDQRMIGHFNGHTAPGASYLRAFTEKRAIEIGYTVYPEFRRLGFATESILSFIRQLKERDGAECVVLSISPTNLPSLLLADKLGFTKVGSTQDEEEGEEWVFTKNL